KANYFIGITAAGLRSYSLIRAAPFAARNRYPEKLPTSRSRRAWPAQPREGSRGLPQTVPGGSEGSPGPASVRAVRPHAPRPARANADIGGPPPVRRFLVFASIPFQKRSAGSWPTQHLRIVAHS